eukprot:gene21577-27615_t
MSNGTPLFTGTSEETQLDTIFRHLGTPNETVFPGIAELPDWRENFTQYPTPNGLAGLVPKLGQTGIELLQMMLVYDPSQRITAQEARHHAFFDSLPENLRKIGSDMS